MNMNDTPLYDGGNFRLYDNRIEIDHNGLFSSRRDVAYYSDITSAYTSGRMVVFTRTGLKTNVVLAVGKKANRMRILDIVNACKR